MADTLFDRRVRLTIAQRIKGDFAKAAPNAVVIEQLTVRFKIEKSLGKEPNQAEISILNLNEQSRAALQGKGARVYLEAGYPDTMAGIFVGDVREGSSKVDGSTWVTRLRCGDGERAYRFASVNESFRPGTALHSVVGKLASVLGLDQGNSAKQLAGDPTQFVNGHSAHGRAVDELDNVLTSAGYQWSIQDGRLQVLKPTEANKDLVLELGSDTGLVGSPEFGVPEKGKAPLLKGRCMLDSRVRCGGRLSLASLYHKGTFKVVKVTLDGDTSGGNWYADWEAEAM